MWRLKLYRDEQFLMKVGMNVIPRKTSIAEISGTSDNDCKQQKTAQI